MQKLMLGARVPKDWIDELEIIASEKGCKVAHVVSDEIAAYLDKTNAATVSSHEQRITALERKLQGLSG
ncbi:hypothetical protein AB3R30_25220 [Leptolyngbyaceae cyanobacterium UHCC 1019]